MGMVHLVLANKIPARFPELQCSCRPKIQRLRCVQTLSGGRILVQLNTIPASLVYLYRASSSIIVLDMDFSACSSVLCTIPNSCASLACAGTLYIRRLGWTANPLSVFDKFIMVESEDKEAGVTSPLFMVVPYVFYCSRPRPLYHE